MPAIVPIRLPFFFSGKQSLQRRTISPGQIRNVPAISSVDHRRGGMAQGSGHPLDRFTGSQRPGGKSMPGFIHPTEWQAAFPHSRHPYLSNGNLIHWPTPVIQEDKRALVGCGQFFLRFQYLAERGANLNPAIAAGGLEVGLFHISYPA